MTKEELIKNFDPNGVGSGGSLFGLPFNEETADLIIIPVPWEVTVSYAEGTAKGPEAVLTASLQVDLYQRDIPDAWKMGIHMLPVPTDLQAKSDEYRAKANAYIQWLGSDEEEHKAAEFSGILDEIEQACEEMNKWVYETARYYRKKGKLVALLGGDHSTPLGMLEAVAEDYPEFGVLHIDAHADLREAYEGFTYSHASIAYNFIDIAQVSKLVQVGIRDVCEAEMELVSQTKAIVVFSDSDIKEDLYNGKTWKLVCDDIIAQLPDKVYLTFDIDGLDPKLCPHTGTPVAGGFELEQILFLIKQLVLAGKKIIGFDLVEVAPGPDGNEWDANVGARLLYRLANLYGVSQGKLKF